MVDIVSPFKGDNNTNNFLPLNNEISKFQECLMKRQYFLNCNQNSLKGEPHNVQKKAVIFDVTNISMATSKAYMAWYQNCKRGIKVYFVSLKFLSALKT